MKDNRECKEITGKKRREMGKLVIYICYCLVLKVVFFGRWKLIMVMVICMCKVGAGHHEANLGRSEWYHAKLSAFEKRKETIKVHIQRKVDCDGLEFFECGKKNQMPKKGSAIIFWVEKDFSVSPFSCPSLSLFKIQK